MGIGRNTLRAVLDTVSKKRYTTRKEISDALGISMMAAHGAVDALVETGFLKVEKNSLHSTSLRGRKSEEITVSPERLCLLIDFCKKNICFSLSPLYGRIEFFEVIPYSDGQDLEINLDFAASHIARYIERMELTPAIVAIAVPDFDKNFSIKDCEDSLIKAGISPDIVVSGARAASEFCSHLTSDIYAFVSVDHHAWGYSSAEPDRMILWEKVKVGAHHGESFASVLHHEKNEDNLCIYSQRFIGAIDAVLDPDKIFIAATALPEKVMDRLCENAKVTDISADTPILNGLLRLAKDEIFKRAFNN